MKSEDATIPHDRRSTDDPSKNVLDHVQSVMRRQDDLREAEAKHFRELSDLLSDHAKEMRESESARIDAVRAIDVGAVQQAATVAATQATTLAAQVATSAETLRTQVAAAASAATIALAAALEPVQKDIADLRRAQYEAQGQKTQVIETQAKGASNVLVIGLIVTVVGLFFTVVGMILTYILAKGGL